MGRPRKVTDGMAAEMARLYADGLSADSIADRFGLTGTSVLTHLREMGVVVRGHAPAKGDWAAMGRDYLAGSTVEDVALRYGVSPSTALRKLREQGVRMRRRGEWYVPGSPDAECNISLFVISDRIRQARRKARTMTPAWRELVALMMSAVEKADELGVDPPLDAIVVEAMEIARGPERSHTHQQAAV